MNLNWKKHICSNGFRLFLTIDVGNKKFTGTIYYSDFTGHPSGRENEAYFTFQSLGISGKKINAYQDEEEMKKEALLFLKKKALSRIDEMTNLVSLIKE